LAQSIAGRPFFDVLNHRFQGGMFHQRALGTHAVGLRPYRENEMAADMEACPMRKPG
jgi:hypothetical protein